MEAGEVTARLNLKTDAFDNKLRAAKRQLDAFTKPTYTARLALQQTGQAVTATSQQTVSGMTVSTQAINRNDQAVKKLNQDYDRLGKSSATASKTVQQSSARMASGLKTANKPATELSRGFEDIGKQAGHSETSVSTLMRTLTKASAVFVGIMALKASITGVGDAIAYTVQQAAGFEQITIGFNKLYGGAERASTMLKDLASFASRTPFELVDTEQQALRLRAYGFAAKDVIPVLRDVGDAAAGLGTGQEGINRITLALGQMRSAGRMNSRDMLQLTEALIPAWDYVAEALDTTTDQVRQMTEQGLVPADIAIRTIRAGMQKDFGGMMSAQMDTLLGQWSNLKDRVTLAARAVGEYLLPPLKEIVERMSDALPKIGRFFVDTVTGANDLGKALRNVYNLIANGLVPIIRFFGKYVLDALNGVIALLAGNWTNAWKFAAKHPLLAAGGVLIVITRIRELITVLSELKVAYATASAVGFVGSLANVATGINLAAQGFTVGSISILGFGATLGAIGTKVVAFAKGILGIKVATLGTIPVIGALTVSLGSLLAALVGFDYWMKHGNWLSDLFPKDWQMEGNFDLSGLEQAKALIFDQASVEDITKAVESGIVSWEDLSAAVEQMGEAYVKHDVAAKIAEESLGGLGSMSKELEASLADLDTAFKTSADDLVAKSNEISANQLNLDALKALQAIADAEGAYAAALKETGAASIATRTAAAQLKVARESAVTALAAYASKVYETTTGEQLEGQVAIWAANVAIQGANAMAAAQSGLQAAIATSIDRFNRLAQAAANAAAQSANAIRYENMALRAKATTRELQAKYDALIALGTYTPPPIPKVGTVGAVGGGGAGGATNKVTAAIEKLTQALEGAIDKVKELAESFKQAAVEAAGAAGTMGEKVSRRGTRGISSALRSQVRKLEKYRDSLLKLREGLPRSVFEDFVLPASIDDVIGMARMNISRIQRLLSARADIGLDIANITEAPRIRKARAEITSDTYSAARKAGANVTINFGGVTIGSNMTPEQFAQRLSKVINRELRAAGVVV
jgi:tape measure domain-containing protein